MPPWPWVILGRVPRLVPGDAEAEHAADFSIPVALPPRVTVVITDPSTHPDPNYPDKYPYIVAVDTVGLLFHFNADPFYGVCFADRPYESNIIVASQFHTNGVQQGHATTATAERIPGRDGCDPIIFDIESIGFVSVNSGEDYLIAELMVDKGSECARLVHFSMGNHKWCEENVVNPLSAHDRDWVPAGVVSHKEKLWWFDLSWGILSCDPFVDDLVLLFHSLPEDRILGMARPDIHDHRCITESLYVLRYVEIIIPEGSVHDQGEAATVYMWTRISAPDGGDETIGWDIEYEMSFAEIWNDDSYRRTELPQKVPVLAVVCPSNPRLVYFALEQEQRLFSVDVPLHRVVDFIDEAYELVTPGPAPPSCRYVLPWFLPLSVAQALGMDPFEEGDETDGDDELQAAEIDGDDELQAAEIDDVLQAAEIDGDDDDLQAGEIDDDELLKSDVTEPEDDAGEGAS
ncbi:uncharacterized protein LOC133925876 [Phragmites australis]|uniref:uncharacterized protein LOC133925876 n=1 Tax=Phragmites australis TaxID=29695 RepID=UPI002D78D90B|nr:uncharacterized protein LOC133925876 [Phragmites australis]